MFTFNPLYLLLFVPMLFAWWAQAKLRKIYEQHNQGPDRLGVSGQEIARHLLDQHELRNVRIERTPGYLTDHYDSQANTLRLSDGVANGCSVTSLGIVAHEVGHAVQDAEDYHFMRLRTFLSRRIRMITQWSSIAFIGGWVFDIPVLMGLSGLILAALLVFSLVTLPVERDASLRALASLQTAGLAVGEEREGVRQMLNAAAFTYLAALAQQMGTFLFFVVMVAAGTGFRSV